MRIVRSRKFAAIFAGATVFQWTTCLGPDPAGFLEDAVVGSVLNNVFAILFSTLLAGAGA